MATDIGQNFITQIPSLSDDADIQEAFRLYHYGIPTEPDGGTPIAANSIESHLQTLSDNIANIQAGQAAITTLDAENLNDVVTTGVYHKATTPSSGLNYPALSAGLLNVTATSGAIYQVFQSIGGASGPSNRYWRGRSATTTDWGAWKQTSSVGHTHDDRYYTETEIDAKISNTLSSGPNSVAVTDSNGKIVYSATITTTELETLDGVTSNIQSQLNDRYTKSESARVFVQQTQPTGASANDIWLW